MIPTKPGHIHEPANLPGLFMRDKLTVFDLEGGLWAEKLMYSTSESDSLSCTTVHSVIYFIWIFCNRQYKNVGICEDERIVNGFPTFSANLSLS